MNVAIVIDIFHDKGNGTSMSARHLVENLVERGIGVKVLCDNAGQQNETMQGVEFVTFPIQQVPIYQKSSSSNTHGLHLRTTRESERR